MILDERSYIATAMRSYDNPSCIAVDEFQQDLSRITTLRKMFVRYEETSELNERIVLNNIIILYNVFGGAATDLLMFRIEKNHWGALFPFLILINRLPEEALSKHTVELDSKIIQRLREL